MKAKELSVFRIVMFSLGGSLFLFSVLSAVVLCLTAGKHGWNTALSATVEGRIPSWTLFPISFVLGFVSIVVALRSCRRSNVAEGETT